MRRRRLSPGSLSCGASIVLLAAALTGCAASPPAGPTSPPGDATAIRVATVHPATVLDDGSGPELCLGIILTSYPPQCSGPALIGWEWGEREGRYEEAAGVRWGLFWVAGSYDPAGSAFTVEDAVPADEHDWPEAGRAGEVDFTTPCPEPAGGWRVLDAARTTPETMEDVLALAERLDGYAGAWLDQSPNPLYDAPLGGDDDENLAIELGMNDPELLIVNVRTTVDAALTESALRERWGGMLCVSAAPRSESEMRGIVEEITADPTGLLASWPDTTSGTIHLEVIFDDGSLQEDLDARYGVGVVRVSSALVPWP